MNLKTRMSFGRQVVKVEMVDSSGCGVNDQTIAHQVPAEKVTILSARTCHDRGAHFCASRSHQSPLYLSCRNGQVYFFERVTVDSNCGGEANDSCESSLPCS